MHLFLSIFLCLLLLSCEAHGMDLKHLLAFMDPGDDQSAGKTSPRVQWGSNSTHIEMQLSYPSLGWIALGFSPNGGMDQSDVLFGYVDDKSHRVFVQDRFLVAEKNIVDLRLDDQQDWVAISGSQNATHTVIRAARKLQTCDPSDRSITNSKTPILFAFHNKDPETAHASITKHTQRGTSTVNLLQSTTAKKVPDGTMVINITMQNIHVSADMVTQHICRFVKIPPVHKKHHVIADKPLIDPRNIKIVHHMIVNLCSARPPHFTSEPFACGMDAMSANQTMPDCPDGRLLGAWAAGGQGTVYPDEAGLPIEPSTEESYVYIQVHYNNVDLTDKKDNSGMSFILTDKLRKNDIGQFSIGVLDLNYYFTLPPGQESFKFTSHCTEQCTSKMPEAITIVGGLLHMHHRGRTISARHFRKNVELPPILQDMNYDYNFQTVLDVVPPRKFLPGDRIQFECTFSSMDENTAVFGGEATAEEMCLAYFNYYPAANSSACLTFYDHENYFQAIGMETEMLMKEWDKNALSNEVTFQEALSSNDTKVGLALLKETKPAVVSFLADMEWSDDKVQKLQEFYTREPFVGLCLMGGDVSFYEDTPSDDPESDRDVLHDKKECDIS